MSNEIKVANELVEIARMEVTPHGFGLGKKCTLAFFKEKKYIHNSDSPPETGITVKVVDGEFDSGMLQHYARGHDFALLRAIGELWFWKSF